MSDERKLPDQLSTNKDIKLHDNGLRAGSIIEQSVSNLNSQQTQALMVKAGEEALRLEVKNREQNMDYVVGKKAAEDHIDTFNMLERGGKTTRQSVTSEIKTGAGNMKIESKSGATCFVASVAYEDPNHEDVMFLRFYRDNILKNTMIGRYFIKWYWNNGPQLAHIVGNSKFLKIISKSIISFMVKALRYSNK